MSTPILRQTLNGIVDGITQDDEVIVLFEFGSHTITHTYHVDQFEKMPDIGDKIEAKIWLGLDVPAPAVQVKTGHTPAPTRPRFEPRTEREPVRLEMSPVVKKKVFLGGDDDEEDILSSQE